MNIILYPNNYEDVSRLLNLGLLKNEFNITVSTKIEENTDILICVDSFLDIFPIGQTILLQRESPLTQHRIWTYENFIKFHTVITHSPIGKNQFKFTEHPEVYPWNPFPGQDKIRKNTKITNRIVFYAGQKNNTFANVSDRFPNITTLYDVRSKLVEDLSKYPNFKVYGANWPESVHALSGASTKYIYGKEYKWDFYNKLNENKFIDINESGADFILVLENTMQPNLMAEKIHDGFISDRVVLYFGEQNIEKHVPLNCFVDLRPFFDKKNKKINAEKLMDIVNNMPQEEYDQYINNARAWRKTLFGRWEEERDKLTKLLIERIKSKGSNSARERLEYLKNKIKNF